MKPIHFWVSHEYGNLHVGVSERKPPSSSCCSWKENTAEYPEKILPIDGEVGANNLNNDGLWYL